MTFSTFLCDPSPLRQHPVNIGCAGLALAPGFFPAPPQPGPYDIQGHESPCRFLGCTQLVLDSRFLWGVLEKQTPYFHSKDWIIKLRWNFQNSIPQTIFEPVVLYGILLYFAFEGGLSRIWKISSSSRQYFTSTSARNKKAAALLRWQLECACGWGSGCGHSFCFVAFQVGLDAAQKSGSLEYPPQLPSEDFERGFQRWTSVEGRRFSWRHGVLTWLASPCQNSGWVSKLGSVNLDTHGLPCESLICVLWPLSGYVLL